LTGVLYFPKLGNQIEVQRNKIQLYSNQMFVTDEVKDIVPEFLTLLHGVIDSPDIPLNVSRSYLQSDRNVKKISEYISRKVADKLDELFRKDRPAFEEKWESMNVFIKYGYISEDQFAERAEKFALLENTQGQLFTLDEYQNKVKEAQTDKNNRLVFLYTNAKEEHHPYIQSANNRGYDVLNLDTLIDLHFLNAVERKHREWSFARVDADSLDNLIKKDQERDLVLSEEEKTKVTDLFKGVAGEGYPVQVQSLSPNDPPVMITRPEFMRRMKEMSHAQSGLGDMPDYQNLIVNGNHSVIAQLGQSLDQDKAQYLFDLARLQQGILKGEDLSNFVKKSIQQLK
jgi:molecular chaperone HtpG